MPFTIVRNDIALMQTDAIVNTTASHPHVGAGTDAAIHAKAGPQLLQARRAVGVIAPGSCAVTPAFGLDARCVIHTVGPIWSGGQQERYGWEFLFLGANIDAAAEASRFGISPDRAAQYCCDREGTTLNYEVISEAVSSVRASRALHFDWKHRIDEDLRKRGK